MVPTSHVFIRKKHCLNKPHKRRLRCQGGEMTHKMHIYIFYYRRKALPSPSNDWTEKEDSIFGMLGWHHNQAWLEWNVSNEAIISKAASLLFSFTKKFPGNQWNKKIFKKQTEGVLYIIQWKIQSVYLKPCSKGPSDVPFNRKKEKQKQKNKNRFHNTVTVTALGKLNKTAH